MIHFDDVVEACTAIVDILETEPSASELLDKQLLDLARAQPEWAKRLHFVQGDPAAVLITEYYGESEAGTGCQARPAATIIWRCAASAGRSCA